MTTIEMDRLVERQNRTWNRMQEIRQAARDEGRDWTAEERANWDAAEAELSQVSEDIERLERHDRLDAIDRRRQDQPPAAETARDPQQRAYDEAFWAYVRSGIGRLTSEQRQLVESGYSEIQNAQSTITGPAGGFTVPEGFRAQITETMVAFGGLLGVVNVISTETGQDLPWPTNNDTANEGEIVGENKQLGERDLEFGANSLRAHIFSSRIVRVALALLQDTGVDLEGFLARKLGERIGRRAARAWTTGTGVQQPQGITTGITVGRQAPTGQTDSIVYTDLVELEHSVDPAYRGQARYAFHDQTLRALRLLEDNDGRPLWVPVPTTGFPATINGWPYTVDNSMPELGAGNHAIVYGDFMSGYIVRQVLGTQMLRLTERYADFLQVGFLAFARMDGMVDDPSAIRSFRNAES